MDTTNFFRFEILRNLSKIFSRFSEKNNFRHVAKKHFKQVNVDHPQRPLQVGSFRCPVAVPLTFRQQTQAQTMEIVLLDGASHGAESYLTNHQA